MKMKKTQIYSDKKEGKKMKVYDIKELSEMLKMNIRTLQRYVREGKLKVSKVGRKYIITEENLKEFLEATEVKEIKENDQISN